MENPLYMEVLMGKPSVNGQLSLAMLNNQRVTFPEIWLPPNHPFELDFPLSTNHFWKPTFFGNQHKNAKDHQPSVPQAPGSSPPFWPSWLVSVAGAPGSDRWLASVAG
jgi:hypothetical protein